MDSLAHVSNMVVGHRGQVVLRRTNEEVVADLFTSPKLLYSDGVCGSHGRKNEPVILAQPSEKAQLTW